MSDCVNFVCTVDVVTLSSVMAIGTMLFVLRFGDWPDPAEKYGWARATIVVSLISAFILFLRLWGVAL